VTFTRDRRLWIVTAALVVGAAVGVIFSYTGSSSRKAEASVLVSSKQGPAAVEPFLPDLRTLATSSLLAGNVRSTLRLSESAESLRARLHAAIHPNTQVIAISATGSSARSAQQLAQEAAVVFSLLVGERFKTTTPPLRATVLDPAHVLGGPNRHILRNALLGALIGLALGTVVAVLFAEAPAAPVGAPPRAARELMRREKLLERRIGSVTARERELASRAAHVKTQERELAKRAHELQRRATAPPPPPPAPAPAPVAPAAEPERVPVEPKRPPRSAEPRIGGWNINELDALVTAKGDAYPAQVEEWHAYLFFLRDHASVDGTLPRQFDALIEEVFSPLV
jgi:capsular polysaccharide biosynthesis protein